MIFINVSYIYYLILQQLTISIIFTPFFKISDFDIDKLKVQQLKAEIVKRGQEPINGNKQQIKAQLQALIDQENQIYQTNTQINKSQIKLQDMGETKPLNQQDYNQQMNNPFIYGQQQEQQQQQANNDDLTLRAFNITGQLPVNNQHYKQEVMEDNMKYKNTSQSPIKIMKAKNINIEQTPTHENVNKNTAISNFFMQQSNYQSNYQQSPEMIQTTAYKLSPQDQEDEYDKPIQFNSFKQVSQGAIDDNNVEKAQKSVRFADLDDQNYQQSNLISNTVVQHVPQQQDLCGSNIIDEKKERQIQLSPQIEIPKAISYGSVNKRKQKRICLLILLICGIVGLIMLSIVLSLDIEQAKLHWGSLSAFGLKIIKMFLPKKYIQQSSHYTLIKPQQCPENSICNNDNSFKQCQTGYYQYQSPLQQGSDIHFQLHNRLVRMRKTIDNILNYRFEKEEFQTYKVASCTTNVYKQKYYDKLFIKQTKKLLQQQAKQFCRHKKQSDVLNDMRITDVGVLQELYNESTQYKDFQPKYISFSTGNSVIQEQAQDQEQNQEYMKFPPIYISTTLDYMNYLPKICQFNYYIRNHKLQFILQILKLLLTSSLILFVTGYILVNKQAKKSFNLIKQYLVDDSMNYKSTREYERDKYAIRESVLLQKFIPRRLFVDALIKQLVLQKLQKSKDIGKSFKRNKNGIAENVYFYKGEDNGYVRLSSSNSSELTDDNDVLIEY